MKGCQAVIAKPYDSELAFSKLTHVSPLYQKLQWIIIAASLFRTDCLRVDHSGMLFK
ncbi:MAG: hypothetical protein ACI9AX_002237, partial [Polaromonas sp.]